MIFSIGYWEFYKAFFDLNHPIFENYQPGIWPHVDVNHLWYLRELWTFSLYLIFLLPLLNWSAIDKLTDRITKLPAFWAIAVMGIPVLIVSATMDETRELIGFIFLVYGYLIGGKKSALGEIETKL